MPIPPFLCSFDPSLPFFKFLSLRESNLLTYKTLLLGHTVCVASPLALSTPLGSTSTTSVHTPASRLNHPPASLSSTSDDPSFSTLAGICCVACFFGLVSTDFHSYSPFRKSS